MNDNINPEHIKTIKEWLGTGSINIFGPQFAGKDTQGKLLVDAFDAAPLLGGGDILRNSVIPDHTKRIMEYGELIPTQDYVNIVLPYLSRPEFKGKPLVLSAVGRWFGEERGVLKVTSEASHPLKAVVYLNLEDNIIWKRWENHKNLDGRGKRRDDVKESLEMRLKEFREKTLPVIDFYREMGILIEVDGNQNSKKVLGDIIEGLLNFATR